VIPSGRGVATDRQEVEVGDRRVVGYLVWSMLFGLLFAW